MTRSEQNERALKGASQNAQKAFDLVRDPEYSAVPSNEKVVWAMAAIIHCDMSRLVVAFDECERDGIARLLWMADIASKLHEAKLWYFNTGSRLLQEIANNKKCGAEAVKKRIKEIKNANPIARIDAYSDYRNKFGYHYDPDAIDYLEKFGNENADSFFGLLTTFVRFSGEWAKLTKAVIQNDLA